MSNFNNIDNIDFYETDKMKFIWGIKSGIDLNNVSPNLETMNDIELIYFKDENKYSLGVEVMIVFDDKKDEKEYLNYLLKEFEKFMIQNNYSTNYSPKLMELVLEGYDFAQRYDSIEKCYAAFSLFVKGFNAL